jgi:hypothetical protein
MTKSIDAKDKSLREILSNVQYSIDFYQRDYKWQAKQCEELVSDLTTRFLESYDPIHARSDVATYPAYFLGSIVLSKKSDGTFIVDGQQRLTTLTLLLIFLRNLQVTLGVSEDPNIQPLIQSTQFGKQNFNISVAERKQVIETLYAGQSITEEPEDSSSLNILSRYQDIEGFFPDECKGRVLPFFLDWLIERVQMVEICAYSDEDAYLVFETMNDRGLSLSPADMLKGYLLSNVRDAAQRGASERTWAESIPKLQSLSAKDATNDFFRTWFRGRYATTYGGASDDYERLGPEFHRWLRDKAEEIGLRHSDDFFEFVSRHVPVYARSYRDIRNRQVSFDSMHASTFFVGEQRVDDGLLLMSVVSTDDPVDVIELKIKLVARYLDIFIYRRLWASKNLTKPALKGTFVSLARDLRSLDLESLTARLYAELTKPGHDNFSTSPPVLTGASRRKIHRLLARLTSYVEVNGGAGTNPYGELVVVSGRSRYEIEHIWPNKFDEYRELFADEAEFQDYRNRIGSLLLIPHSFNRSYKDMKTDEKIPLYGRSDHHLLVASLASQTYLRNSKFSQWREQTGFRFESYDLPSGFTRQASEARLELYRELARAIWAPDLLIRDSGLDAQRIRDLADVERAQLTPEAEPGRTGRTQVDVQLIDLIQVGLVSPGDILTGRRPGASGVATAMVLDDGAIELENHQRYTAVSTAAMSLGLGVVINGWQYWVHERSGKVLNKLREEYLGRIGAGDGQALLFEDDDQE